MIITNAFFVSNNIGILYFLNSISVINNSLFNNCDIFSIISQQGLALTLSDSSFINIKFRLGILLLSQMGSVYIDKCIISFSNGDFAIFFASNTYSLIINTSIIKNSSFYTLFFNQNMHLNILFDIIIQSNILRSIWDHDQTVDETFANKIQLKSNYFLSCMYANYGVPNSVISLEELYIHQNMLEAFAFVSMLVGTINMEKTIIIYNIYVDPSLFQASFDFETTTLTRLTNSYIENIGVNTKKTFFIGIEDNCVISFWYTDYSYLNNVIFVVTSNIDLSSGFISGSPIGNKLDIFNCKFIKIGENNLFGYKGMLLDSVAELNIINSTFHDIPCNQRSFSHAHGMIYVTGSSGYLYSKNDFNLNLHNNSFYNCSCIYGGHIAIISINTINITNCFFYNSSSTYFGGSFLIISSPNVFMSNLTIDQSVGNEGGAFYLKDIFKSQINNITIKNSMARRSGVVYLSNVNELMVENCQSINTITHMNGGFMYISKSYAIINHTMVFNSTADEGGAFFLHGNSIVFFDNLVISKSTAILAGGISVYEVDNFKITNSRFINVFAKLEGAAIVFSVFKNAIVSDIEIHNSSSGAGILYLKTIDETSNMVWNNVSCISTFASIGSCIYSLSATSLNINELRIIDSGLHPIFLQWSFLIKISISNLLIMNYNIQSNLIFCSSIDLELKFVNILNIKSPSSIIFVQNSILSLKDSNFTNVTQYLIVEIENSNFEIKNIKIINSIERKISFLKSISSIGLITDCDLNKLLSSETELIFFSNGNLTINRMQCFDNMGRFIRLYKSNFIFTESIIKNNTSLDESDGNDIIFLHPFNELLHVRIEEVNFTSYKRVSCNFNGFLSILLFRCNFRSRKEFPNENDMIMITTAILGLNFNNMNISSCYFTNFTNRALLFQTDYNFFGKVSNLEIYHSNFIENEALLGGAIFLSGSFKPKLVLNIFGKNNALINNLISNHNIQGIGGCIYYTTSIYEEESFELISNYFYNNFAANYISTIFSQRKIISDSQNKYEGNSDDGKFLSFPLKTRLKDISKIELISGVRFSFKLELIDAYNKTVYFDNSSIFALKSFKQEINNTILMENTLGTAEQGIISFNNVNIKTYSKSNFVLLITGSFQGLKSSWITQQEIANQYNFFVRECRKGEIILSDLTCMKCPKGKYSFIDPMLINIKYQKCIKCPENSECPGGNLIYPKPGFYKKTNYSTNVVACVNQEACFGVILSANSTFNEQEAEAYINNRCLEGNSGALCFYCDFGFGRYEKFDHCKKCATVSVQAFARIAAYSLFMTIYIFVNIQLAENYSKKKKRGQQINLISTFIKMIINHSQQFLLIISASEFSIPFSSSLMQVSDYFSFSNSHVIANDCIIQMIFFDKKYFIIYKEILNAILPFIFSLFSFFLWFLTNFILSKITFFESLREKIPKDFCQMLTRLKLFLIICGFIFYSLILKSSFNLFDCFELDHDDEKTYLRISPDITCWESEHLTFMYIFGIPCLLIWGLSFPFVLTLVLRKNYLRRQILSKLKEFGKELGNKSEEFKNLMITRNHRNIYLNLKGKMRENLFSEHQKIQISNQKYMYIKNKKSLKNFQPKDQYSHIFSVDRKINLSENLAAFKISKGEELYLFFYKDFNDKNYFWEPLIFFRKFLITFISTVNEAISDELKSVLLIAVFNFYIYITLKCKPYKNESCNKYEILSLVILLFTSVSSLILSSKIENLWKYVISWLVLILNLAIYFFWIFSIIKKLLQILKNKRRNKVQVNYNLEQPKKLIEE